jgi:hypothetical protein
MYFSIVYAILVSAMPDIAWCSYCLSLLDFITLTALDEEYKFWWTFYVLYHLLPSRETNLYRNNHNRNNYNCFFSVAVQSLKDLGRLTYRRFLELFRHLVWLLRRVISPSQGLYLHRTTQHRKMRTNIHALSGIRTHDPSSKLAKTHTSDRTATVTG